MGSVMPLTRTTKGDISMSESILSVSNLNVSFPLEEGLLEAVRGVSFEIGAGRTLGLVGESGCGKSVTAQALLRLLPKSSRIDGEIRFRTAEGSVVDVNTLGLNSGHIRKIRGAEITMIFQEPLTSFSPLYSIGNQIIEQILLHFTSDPERARERAIEMLDKVGIPEAEKRVDAYPFELSGGMRQRAMIAMALSANPKLLIADEPTTALDVTIQAQVLDLMKDLQREFGMSIMFITHDLGVVAEMCDDVAIMYLGKIVEYASVQEVFGNPRHPYTVALLNSIPKLGEANAGKIVPIEGSVPVPMNLKKACNFSERCPYARRGLCDAYEPPLVEVGDRKSVACFLYPEVRAEHEKKQTQPDTARVTTGGVQ